MAEAAHSAIPTWSGYIYQGKVAFFHSLCLIEKELLNDLNYDFSDYGLEIEWQEDFAIKKKKSYLSVHQVKANKDDTEVSKYKNAISGLLRKVQNLNTIGFLHVWTDIKYNSSTTDFNNYKFNRFNHKMYPRKYANRINIYQYPSGNEFCDIDEIDQLLLNKISGIYNISGFLSELNIQKTSKQFKNLLFNLYKIIDEHIIFVHKNNSLKNKTKVIRFVEILTLFQKNYEDESIEYKQIKTKNFILKCIKDYCNNLRLCDKDICEQDCIIYKIEKQINHLPANDLFLMLLRATPHFESENDIYNEEGVKFALIRTLHNVDFTYKIDDILYLKKNKYYLTSTITGSDVSEISKKILNNKSLDFFLNQFEIDYIISNNVNIIDLKKEAQYLKSLKNDVDLEQLFINREETKVNKIKNIKVKDFEVAKGEIENVN
jgi:hypothetical protein